MFSPQLYHELSKIFINERIDDAHKRRLLRAIKGREHPVYDFVPRSLSRLGELLENLGRNLQGLQSNDCGDISRLDPRGTTYG